MLDIRLLGQFHAQLDDKNIEVPSHVAQALLAYLTFYGSKKHSRDMLVGYFWADCSLDIGRRYLRNTISQICNCLGRDPLTGEEFILTDRGNVWLNRKVEIISDIDAVIKPISGQPTIESLTADLMKYGGDFLTGFSEDWVLLERAQLKSAFERKIEILLDLLIADRCWSEVLEWAERWIKVEQTSEAAFRAMMITHASQGEESKVDQDFRRCEEILIRELGIPPSELTSRTYHQLTLQRRTLQPRTGENPKVKSPDPESFPSYTSELLSIDSYQLSDSTRIPLNTLINGRYRLDQELGGGFMGVVYQGYDTLLGRQVAVKVLRREHLGVAGYFRMIQEAQTIAKINHPNIVTIHDAGEFNGIPYMVIELLHGDSLLKEKPKPLEEVIRILLQICDALQQVHSYGIVHRDLKPENVMILPDGKIKLMDFGLVHYDTSRITHEGEILGTVFYLSPEQASGKPVDQRTDIYALGVLAYELTTGQLPFTGENMVSVISHLMYTDPIRPSEINSLIPQSLERSILRMLAKSPEDRPGSISEVIDVLGKIQREIASQNASEISPGEVWIEEHPQATTSTNQDKQKTKSGVHLLVESWRKKGLETLDVASLALVHSSPPETTFEVEDALLLIRSVLQLQVELDPWLERAGSKENAVKVLERLLEEYPKPDIRLKVVKSLEGLNNAQANDLLFKIATSDDSPNVRSEASLAAARHGMYDQVLAGLLVKMKQDNDVAALVAFVALVDEFGFPNEKIQYPKFTVSLNFLQRRLRAKNKLIWQQSIRCAIGGALFSAINGIAAPFYAALSRPDEFQEYIKIVSVASWMVIGAFGLLILGLLQGFASGLALGFADAIWMGAKRRFFRLIFGGLSGLATVFYLIWFTLMGAIAPNTVPSIYYPTYFVYGSLLGIIITIVVPFIEHPRNLRIQLMRIIIAGMIAALMTVPYVYIIFTYKASEEIIRHIMITVMLIFGVAVFSSSQRKENNARIPC